MSPVIDVLSRVRNNIRQIRSALWFRPALMSAVSALVAALLVRFDAGLSPTVPAFMSSVGRESVQQLLRFMAGGMLTVTTVTLSVLILVLSLAAGQASPRSVPELMADQVTQNALGTFLSAFVFSLVSLALLEFEAVESSAVAWIFIVAVLLLAASVKYLVQWIHHVAETMKLNRIVASIHAQCDSVLTNYLAKAEEDPAGKQPSKPEAVSVFGVNCAGFVQLVDVERLDQLAADNGLVLEVSVHEGDFVHEATPLGTVWSRSEVEGRLRNSIRSAIIVGPERSSKGDPLLGFELLTEVACRALSTSVNDQQSAVICIQYLGALLAKAGAVPPSDYPAGRSKSGRVAHPTVGFGEMVTRAFGPIGREGAGSAEVVFQVIGVLTDLAETVAADYLPSISMEAERAGEYGADRLTLKADRERLSEKLSNLLRIADRRLNVGNKGRQAPAGT